MAVPLRKQGVYGDNLPAKKTQNVTASNFQIAGLIGNAKRQYLVPFKITKIEEYNLIFGSQENPANYMPDTVKGFFDNAAGTDASLYVQTLTGYDTGTPAVDAVAAFAEKADAGLDADAYLLEAAYLSNLQYGAAGNRTGYKFTQVARFETLAAATVAATGVSIATLDSVIDITVGDIIKFITNAGADDVYKIITAVDQTARTVSWTGDFETAPAAGETLALDDPVEIPGFTVQIYNKSLDGRVVEVDEEKGKIICSSESAVSKYYVNNIFADHNYILITEQSASTLEERLPPADASIVYLTSGAEGTAVVSEAALSFFLAKLDTSPIRMLHYPESINETLQKSIITYSLGRVGDNPIVIVSLAENRSKSQMITAGNNYQVSDFAPAVIINNWLEITDPFNSSPSAPKRNIPAGGHVMGAWVRSISQLGIHYIPATQATTLRGLDGVVGDQLLNATDRTEVLAVGVNVIQQLTGIGFKIASFSTISADIAYFFANIIIFRNFIKVSVVDSLQSSENTPNTFERITGNASVIQDFMLSLWDFGSTGSVPAGETFGQTFDENGNPSSPGDHIQVIADPTNNPQKTSINLGQQNYAIYFSGPTPAGSIRISVGLLLL